MEKDTRKKSFVSGILLSIALYFMIFFFAPIDVFLSDQREFIIPARHIIFPMLVTAVAAVTVSVLVLYCIYRANKKVYDIVICLMLGLLLSFYCQELFMNGYMKSIVGNIYIYSEPLLEYKINFVINDIIFFAPLILWLVRKNYPNLKALSFADDKAVNYICAIVFIMQASGTVGIFAQNGIYNNKPDGEIEYLSYKPAMSLSKDKNVIVFLTDRLDSLWLDSTIEKYPELNEVFDGFTFYRNNISEYTNTFPSVANLLTDAEYEGESWTGYFDKAWAENNETLPDILKKNGYNVNLLIEKSTGYGELKNLNGRCDNAVKTNADVKYNYLEKEGIVRTMTRLSFGKLTPYIFKDFFIGEFMYDFANKFYTVNGDINDRCPEVCGVDSDMDYLHYMLDNGLNADSDKKTFTFTHLIFCHDPQPALATLYEDYKDNFKTDYEPTIRGGCVILEEYFLRMKQLGIYDNSTIIILGDHGRAPREVEGLDIDSDRPMEKTDKLLRPIVTGLLVKPQGSRGKLKFDDKSELSNGFFAASVMEYAGIDHKDKGLSYNDVITNALHPKRDLHLYRWLMLGKVEYLGSYEVSGNARDFADWNITNK